MDQASVRRERLQLPAGSFELDVAGERGAPLVLLLHGFPQTSHSWRSELPALAAAGFYAIAPNQRGYSPGARPARVEDYALDHLIEDALAIARSAGAERFHLVGHDWGGQLAWLIAARYPQQLLTLTVLSRPHPAAFAAAIRSDDAQSERSRHHRAFQDPSTAARLLADGARRLRRTLSEQGVSEADIHAYLECLGEEPALNAALNWYRAAIGGKPAPDSVPSIQVPTLYIWGEADKTVGRAAAEATANHVQAPYHFLPIPRAGHFLTDQVASQVTAALLQHLRQPR